MKRSCLKHAGAIRGEAGWASGWSSQRESGNHKAYGLPQYLTDAQSVSGYRLADIVILCQTGDVTLMYRNFADKFKTHCGVSLDSVGTYFPAKARQMLANCSAVDALPLRAEKGGIEIFVSDHVPGIFCQDCQQLPFSRCQFYFPTFDADFVPLLVDGDSVHSISPFVPI